MLLASAAPLPVVGAVAGRSVVYPAHNQEGIVQQPSFTWAPEPGASAYEIEIAADYDCKKVVVPVTRVETPRFVPLQPLYPATRFWRVRPIAADGNAGKWSDTRVYKLHAPANKINIPANATLAEIRAAIAAAPASSLITFAPKAAYRLKLPQGDTHFLVLEKRDDLIIDGNDSLFIIESPSAGAVAMRDCRRVTLRRFRFDYDPLPHSIGTVESVNPAPAGEVSTVTLRRLPGYPDFDAPHMLANWGWGVILDPVIPGRMKAGSPLVVGFPGAKVTRNPAGADLFNVGISSANHAKFFARGDRVIIFARAHSNAFCTADAGCGDITLDRIVTHAAPGLQFVGIGSTDFKLLSCASVPRDATRFFAGNADGVHVRANLLGPWIEGCTFNGIGDDGVALYNKGMAIGARPAPDTLTVAGTFMHLQPGDTFVIFNPFDGQLLGAPRTVTAVRPAGEKAVGGASGHWQQSAARADEASAGRAPATAGSWDVTFTPALETGDAGFPMGDATWWKNAQLFNRTRVNAGFVVKNNTFTAIRRYGVIARATDGVIAGNTITGSSNSGITLLNEPNFWANGLHSERVLIARNKISASAFDASSSGAGSIVVNLRSLYDHSAEFRPKDGPVPKPARLHRGIRIEDNTITDWNHRAILLRSATDCVIKGNTITASPGAKFLDPDSDNIAILVDNTRDCVIADNDTTGDHRLTTAAQRLSILDSDNTAADGQVTSGK